MRPRTRILSICFMCAVFILASDRHGYSYDLPIIISSKNEFKTFWGLAKDKDTDGRVRIFEKVVISKNRPIYKTMVEKSRNKLRKRAYKSLSGLTQDKVDVILNNFSVFEDAIPDQLLSFRRYFPDAVLNATYWLGVSLRFDGKVRDVELSKRDKRVVMGFGMEHFQPGDNLGLIFSHEMVHLYRSEKLGFPPPNFWPMLTSAWAEGIAVYTSGVINNVGDYGTILFDKKLGSICERDYQSIIRLFLHQIDSREDGVINMWFRGNDNANNENIPERAGYCVGLKVVEHLSKNNRLDEMIKWSLPKVQDEFISAAEYLCSHNNAQIKGSIK